MKTFLLSCEFNMDTSCVEARFSDGTMISVDCKAVETALDADTWQRSELDWLIYNKPLEYLHAVFSGEIEDFLPAVFTTNEGVEITSLGACIYACDAENIVIAE